MKMLGRLPARHDPRTLRLSKYLTALPPAPPARDWTKGTTQWGEMLNDSIGDCTIAALGHACQTWSLNSINTEVTVADSDILAAYEKWCGYNPADPSTDVGGVELDVLNDFKRDGLAGHFLTAYADPTVQNLEEVRQAINLFGGVYIGITLTNAQLEAPVWDVIPNDTSGIAGGHAVWVPKYDQSATPFTCITWGALQPMTQAFWEQCVNEVHALLGSLWINADTGAPSGFDLTQLQADLAGIS
jgi:hypothetical protein